MSTIKLNASQLYKMLLECQLDKTKGIILFSMAEVTVSINTTDTVGITLQAWIKQFLINNGIYFQEPHNTQEFPDFYLDDVEPYKSLLEIKAFNFACSPAFDIANFESYCSSISIKPYRLDADYLILGYTMDQQGYVCIKQIWLHKIWEIAGSSQRYALKTQVKRNVIYNIRPNASFKYNREGPFKGKEDFLFALYKTLRCYRGDEIAEQWLIILSSNFKKYYGYDLDFTTL